MERLEERYYSDNFSKLSGNEFYRIACVFPETYEIGICNLGHQIVTDLINRREYFLADRFYTDIKEKSAINQLPITDFDAIWVSLSFESNLINIVQILSFWNIPLFSNDRNNDFPLIICGGLLPTYNTEPYADFFDAMIIGEGEVCIEKILDTIEQIGKNKKTLLDIIADFQGVYIPKEVTPIFLGDNNSVLPNNRPHQTSPVNINNYPAHTYVSTFASYYKQHCFSIEIRRGCNQNCRFCLMGTNYRMCRELTFDNVEQLVKSAKEKGTKFIKLFYEGLLADISKCYFDIIQRENLFARVGSQRLETTSYETISYIATFGQRKITFAPESSSKIRKLIGKDSLNNAELFDKISYALDSGIVDIGLYFIIGLPTEDENDLREIANIINEVHRIQALKKSLGNIVVGVNPFYPKPFTSLQYCDFIGQEEALKRFKYILSQIKDTSAVVLNNNYVDEKIMSSKGKPDNFKLFCGKIIFETSIHTDLCFYQPILSRGDRKVSKLLVAAALEKPQTVADWNRLLESLNLNIDSFYKLKEQPYYPWNIVNHNINVSYLEKECRLGFSGISAKKCVQNCNVCELQCTNRKQSVWKSAS